MKNANVFRSAVAGLAVAVLGFGVGAAPATAAECNAQASGLIKNLEGSWRGSGSVTPIGGAQGRISCRVGYNSSGDRVGLKISCKGADYNFEANADVQCSGASLSGSWEEKIANNTGSVSGKISGSKLGLDVNGPNFQGRIALNVASAAKHSLTITQFDPAAGRQVPVASVALSH